MRYFVDEPDENGEVRPHAAKEPVLKEEAVKKEAAQAEIKKE